MGRWTVLLAVLLVLLARLIPEGFSSIYSAPPYSVEPSQHDYVEYREFWLSGKRQNHLTWDSKLEKADWLLVLGDSYADDVDMGFSCWPSQLGAALQMPLVSTARGGSEARDALKQLERAADWAQKQGLKAEDSGSRQFVFIFLRAEVGCCSTRVATTSYTPSSSLRCWPPCSPTLGPTS